MIAHLVGKISEKFGRSLILDVSGVGYEVALSEADFEALNVEDTVKLYTYHAVRENAEELFGFTSLVAKKLFEMLISVNGIGPKAAMAILSLGSPEDVRNAIANADAAFVSKAAGVGKKSAERVIVDLSDKVGIPSHYGTTVPVEKKAENDEALDALMALGFQMKEAAAALAGIDADLPTEERIRLALKG